MTSIRKLLGPWARAALAPLALLLAACSGAVSGPPETATPGPITILPSTATLYSDLPTTFVVTGGNGEYFITSSNQAVVPVIGSFTGNAFTVVPGGVAADTDVTLTVRDTGSTTPATASLTVKPRTVSHTVSVTPSASQSTACGASICAGGDAEVRAVLTQGGVPLRNREVRFDVISGDFRIITSPAGTAESLSLSGTTFTDDSGTARIRVRVLSDATAQTGLLRITDVGAGSFTDAAIHIAPSSNAPLNAQPSTISFTGPDANTCATGITADVIVFGGRPPYVISQPGAFQVTPAVVTFSGGRFNVRATGQCASATPIAIVDNNGATVSVTAANVPASITVTPQPLVVSPTEVTLETCETVANVAIAGGLGGYFAATGNTGIQVRFSSDRRIVSIQRASPSQPITSSAVTVSISDGRTTQEVTVNVTGAAQLGC